MESKTILKRDSLISSNDYIYPDFKKCQLILFSLALLEYVIIPNLNLYIDIITLIILINIYYLNKNIKIY